MKTSIERYILWLAPALVVQFASKMLLGEAALRVLEGPATHFLLSPGDLISVVSLGALIGHTLPGIVTGVWIFLSYFVLVPYVAARLLEKKPIKMAELGT